MEKGNILVVDDDAFSRTLCSDILREGGFAVRAVSSGAEALEVVENDEPVDIVITDLVMPDVDGLEVLERTRQHNTLVDVIVVTGHGSLDSAISALRKGAFDYIRKPVDEEDLLLTVNNCLEKKKLLEENQEMRQSLKLFEVSRSITTTLDINRLYDITIDAFLQMLSSRAGALAFFDDNRELDIKATRHMETDDAGELIKVLRSDLGLGLDKMTSTRAVKVPAEAAGLKNVGEAKSVVVSPFVRGGVPMGVIFVFSPSAPRAHPEKDIINAEFIAEHASQAFENAQKYVEAKEMAFIDSLTNLYNSKYLDTALDKELKRADRLQMPVTVLFLDLDNFKLINDRNDHLVGSRVLVEVGRLLLKCVREVDTVIRYGGDEYVVILVDADSDSAFRVADRIRATIEGHSFLTDDGLGLRITTSVGVATYPVHTRDKNELLKMADKAMYRAKGMSKNMVYLAPLDEPETGEATGKGA